MAYLNFSSALKTSRAAAISTAMGASGFLLFYTGSAPASPDSPATGTLLATLSCAATFGTASGGALTINSITTANATANGTAGYARFTTAGGAAVIDMDVTASGGGGYVQVNTTAFAAGASVSVTNTPTITEA